MSLFIADSLILADYLTDLADDHQSDHSLTASDLRQASETIRTLANALDKHERKPEAVDMLAVWEHYLDLPTEIDKIPEHDALSRRQYVVDHLTAYCDKWWMYVHTFFSYEDSYSWEFLPAFLGGLPTHEVDQITPEQLTAALCAVVDSDSFRRFEKAKEQGA